MRQPIALPYLFLTELWERFGFYIVQGMLILYMTEYFGYTDAEGYTILGVFTALAYISPLVGGFLANKIIGYRVAIIWGGLLLFLGYFQLALPYAESLLYPALATIIVGNGLFKPNISSLLGTQYDENDTRRDSGFTIFYVGINIGAFLAGLSAGYIRIYFGWEITFLIAGLGLLVGLITFIYGLRYVKSTQTIHLSLKAKIRLFSLSILAIIGVSFLLRIYMLADILLPIVGVALLIFLGVLTYIQNPEYRRRLLLLNILILSSVVFWMLFLQMFSSANLFVERLVDKDILGFHLSTTVFWGSEGLFIILLGPIFASTWQSLGQHDKNPSPFTKFTLGIFFAGLGFLLLVIGTYFPNSHHLINPFWVFGAYLLITIGELLLSPIGLSAVTILAPANLIGLMMGVWFVAVGFGGIFAGMLARIASVPDTFMAYSERLAIYQEAFLIYASIAFFVSILLFFIQKLMRRLLSFD